MGKRRPFLHMLLIGTIVVGLFGGLYAFWGVFFIKSIYEGRSLGFLNEIMAGRDVHPLDFYISKANFLMRYVLLWMLLMEFMVVAIVSQGRALVRWIGKGGGYTLLMVLSLVIAFLIGELVVRMAGFKPWNPIGKSILVEPVGRLFELHPKLGYAMLPGRYTVTLHTGYKYTVTHGDDFLRITHPIDWRPAQPYKGEIWIFGCSFTYGWSLSDEQTYPWLLQDKFQNYRVVNWGTGGYGTLHAITQFREALKSGREPVVAIYAYGSFHDERNTFPRGRRKAVGPANQLGPFRQPYARLRKGQLYYAMTNDVDYNEFPFMRYSALINFIEERYDALEARLVNSREVTERILINFNQVAKDNNVPFLVAGIDSESFEILAYLREHGIPAVDISVDLSKQMYRNWPHDGHPNALANLEYAQNLAAYLRKQPYITTEEHSFALRGDDE